MSPQSGMVLSVSVDLILEDRLQRQRIPRPVSHSHDVGYERNTSIRDLELHIWVV